MKFRLLAGVGIAAVMAGSAFAADMPLKAPPPVLAYDWSGFYIGGVIGGGWARTDTSDPGLGLIGTLVNVPVIQTTTSSGFIGGIEGGDRYQFGKLVIGWEADMDCGATRTAPAPPPSVRLLPPGILTRTLTADTKWTGTATSTVGIAHDRWLIYGKAGVAWAKTDYTDNWADRGLSAVHRHRQHQQLEPGRLDRGNGHRVGDLEQLVDQGRIRLSRLRQQDHGHQRHHPAGRFPDPGVVRELRTRSTSISSSLA